MNSAKAKKKEAQTKKVKTQKGINQKKKESDAESTSLNYFRIVKELEKQKSVQNLSKEMSKKDNKLQKNITELIYSKNSKKLGNFYDKNKNDLLLYGSSKYDVLTMDKLVNEMGNNKSKVLNKIKENTYNNKNDKFSNLADNNKVILTPLCENEKERTDMETLEKKKFDEANRIGVVMRRIEYNCLLNNRNKKTHKNKEMTNKIKNAVDKIERCWLRYRNRKNRIKNSNIITKEKNTLKKDIKLSSSMGIGHFELEYIGFGINSNMELEELKKKYDKLNELYLMTKKEVDKLNSENK